MKNTLVDISLAGVTTAAAMAVYPVTAYLDCRENAATGCFERAFAAREEAVPPP